MKSNKILHVINSMDPVLGGVSKAVETIAMSLINDDIDNEVVCLDEINSYFVKESSFKIHALGRSYNPWGYNPELFAWLKQNVTKYNTIVVHGLWLYNSYAVYKTFRKIKQLESNNCPKYYVMPHGMLDPYFQKAKGRTLKALRNMVYWKLIEQKVVNQSNGLLFTCEEESVLAKIPFKPYHPKKEILVGLGIETPPIGTTGIDNAFFKFFPNLKKRPFILFLSRIHEKKGVDLLLDAYEHVVSKFMNDKSVREVPQLVIAGPGLDSDYGKMMQGKVSNSKVLKNKITFPGMLSGDLKWGAFYNCEAFILPSHQENFGIAIAEALACSKPVLITDKINIWKEISNSSAGIVENDTLKGTIKALEQWMKLSEKEKAKMSEQAKACYQGHFALDAVVSNWKNKVLSC